MDRQRGKDSEFGERKEKNSFSDRITDPNILHWNGLDLSNRGSCDDKRFSKIRTSFRVNRGKSACGSASTPASLPVYAVGRDIFESKST
ncbi:Hypothetical predicted protein [Octopus vulgaris]|uniref:Uncharacterized protein n=1 Tax=Octopus vulgaris TaxID=6645 RepID=A0AA36F2F7_OCTVU|nr:Hypothetical predicted protein [Octopus vulgaris]